MITAAKNTTRGHAPRRWKRGFEPGVSAHSPAVAFGVVRMAWQVEPVDAPTARIPHARFGPCGSLAGFGTPVDSAGATASAR
ncbi:hypothetical protein KPA97_48860, partial [Burkholderia cenocepacia]|nr:hypothetical protein [Burkholderia cenocepacia]MDR5667981.1 hypothetical protein [Burkholderia cenocepacia]